MTTGFPACARRVSWLRLPASRASAAYSARLTGGTGGEGRRRVSAASRSHWAGRMPICAAVVRSAAYSAAETRTPMVERRTAAGSPGGRPPLPRRGGRASAMSEPPAVGHRARRQRRPGGGVGAEP